MTRLPRVAVVLLLLVLLGLAPLAGATAVDRRAPRAAATTTATALAPEAERLLAELEAGASLDAAATALVDRASSSPADAAATAAVLLLLDRPDDAVETLVAAGRLADAVTVLTSLLRPTEALDLGGVADVSASADAGALRLARARALVLAGRRADAAELLTASATDLRALRAAGSLGLRDDVLGPAMDLAASADPPVLRELPGALWPAQRLPAEAAWRWLREERDASAADSLLRLRAMLDPREDSRDAGALLEGGVASLGRLSDCEAPRMRSGLVRLALLRGDDEAALRLAREWAATNEDAGWMTLGDILRSRQDWAGAAEAYARVAPRDAAARWLASAMLRRAGDSSTSTLIAARIDSMPERECDRLRLASVMDAVGHREGAASLRRTLLPGAAAAPRATGAALVTLRSSDPAALRDALAAARSSRRAAARGPLTVDAVLPVVMAAQAAELRALVGLGRLDEATALLDRVPDLAVRETDALADLAALLRAEGREDEAASLVGAAEDRLAREAAAHPGSAKLQNARAWLGARTGLHLDEALAAAETAAALAPDDPSVLDTLAEVRFQLGDRAGALEAGRRALVLQPHREYLRLQAERFASGDPSTRPPLHAD